MTAPTTDCSRGELRCWKARGFRALCTDVLSIADASASTHHRRHLLLLFALASAASALRLQPRAERTRPSIHASPLRTDNLSPCRDPDQQPPSAQDVLTHNSSPSPILPNQRQHDYSQRSWRLYCVPHRPLKAIENAAPFSLTTLAHQQVIVGFSRNETRRGRSSSLRWSKGIS